MSRPAGSIIGKNLDANTSNTSGIWTVPQVVDKLAAGKWQSSSPWGDQPYQIERSLRFNSADSAYLNRTPAGAGDRKTWTYSFWIKRSKLTRVMLLGVYTSAADVAVIEIDADQIYWYDYLTSSYRYELRTTQVLRDPSAWYHIMCVLDTTQATSSNRNKIYINGSLVTALTTATYPTPNLDGKFNTAAQHSIGTEGSNVRLTFDGYQTETYFIDGFAYDPTYFGEFNPITGVWQPKEYEGTYGTNGFYLNFSDNSGTTSTTLGKDQAGSNNWTPNGFSVTAGAGNDSLVDTCTLFGTDTGIGGEVRGNYATMNPLDQAGGLLFSEGNLKVTANTGWDSSRSTFSYPSTGKWYWEALCIARSTGAVVGILSTSAVIVGDVSDSAAAYVYNSGDGNKYNGGVNLAYGATWTTNDLISIAWDADIGTLSFYKNGVSQGTAYSSLSGQFSPVIGVNGSDSMQANFGNRPFAYTAPSGYKALVTTNLPNPTVIEGDEYFNTVLWTGNNANPRTITGVGFQPDWVWVKDRSSATNHRFIDAVRGGNKTLKSNTTDAETASEVSGTVSAFTSDGFTLAGTSDMDGVNLTGNNIVAWNWNAGGSTVTNTSGSISAQVRASTDAGFSIVTYTGTGAAATVGHGLGVAPKMIFFKVRSNGTYGWYVYNSVIGATNHLVLDTTAASSSSSFLFNDTAPTSTVMSVGTSPGTNQSGETYVAYCFAAIPGYSAFGSFEGNGVGDGPFVYTNFRVKWLLIKRYDASGDPWWIIDAARSPYNQTTLALRPNASNAEDSGGNANFDFLSNGFKARTSGGGNGNESGADYIYMAFSEAAFKYSLAR